MLMSCVMLALTASAYAPAAEAADPFEPEILVRAKAVRVDYKGYWAKVAFTIEYVYCGDAKLKGTTFKDSFVLYPSTGLHASLNDELQPPIKEGEIGIWHLERSDEDGSLIPNVHNRGTHKEDGLAAWQLAPPAPARKIIGHQGMDAPEVFRFHYAAALRWASVVETVYKTARAERLPLLKKYISSDNPYVAAWSVRMLTKYKPTDLIPFLEERIGDPKLAVAAQVTIDNVLCDMNRKKWIGSKHRQSILDRWVSGEIIETLDVLIIAVHIKDSLEMRGGPEDDVLFQRIDWETWLPLMEKWVVQQHLSPALEWRLYYIFDNRDKVQTGWPRKHIAPHAFRLLKTAKDQETQAYAAKWLCRINDLTAEELAIVKDLKDKSTNDRIRRLLESAIAHSTPKRRP